MTYNVFGGTLNPTTNGQAELTLVAGYIVRWFINPKLLIPVLTTAVTNLHETIN